MTDNEMTNHEMTNNIVWLSLDPLTKKIDYYPINFSIKLETAYNNFIESNNNNSLFLGKDFYNATIYFDKTNNMYQTTPGICMYRGGGKPPGYRSVKRIKLINNQDIELNIKSVHNEWRICNELEDYRNISRYTIVKIKETVPSNVVINSLNKTESYAYWKNDDLNDDLKYIIAWQWCSVNNEEFNNAITLPNNYWLPYLYEENIMIETAYSNKEDCLELNIDENIKRMIYFNKINNYGKQITKEKDIDHEKVRICRRTIITIKQLKESMNQQKIYTINSIMHNINNIPDNFICCITQEIMREPVKLIDGHIYDKLAIIRWFEHNNTSPLTGLKLDNLTYEYCEELHKEIQQFINSNLS